MTESPAQRALTASTASLAVAGACLVLFIPPLLERTLDSVLRVVLVATTMAVAQLLHWVFLGMGARRLGRRVAGWVALSVLLFPVGSVAALILLAWFGDEVNAPAAAA